jgi:hypothetical protein
MFRPTVNCICGGRKSRLSLGKAWYHSVQNLSSSRLLSKNEITKIYKTIILPVVSYGCKTWCLRIVEYGLRVFVNRFPRTAFGPKREGVATSWRNYITSSFIICTHIKCY